MYVRFNCEMWLDDDDAFILNHILDGINDFRKNRCKKPISLEEYVNATARVAVQNEIQKMTDAYLDSGEYKCEKIPPLSKDEKHLIIKRKATEIYRRIHRRYDDSDAQKQVLTKRVTEWLYKHGPILDGETPGSMAAKIISELENDGTI